MRRDEASSGGRAGRKIRDGIARSFSTSILSNYFWSVLNLVLSRGLRLIAITLCVRQMGAESWGAVASTIAFMSLIGLAASQGLGGLPQIFRVNERALDRPLLFHITAYRLLMASIVLAGLRLLAPHVGAINPLVLLYAWVLIPRALNIEWLLHRRERYHLTVTIGSLRAVLFIALAVTLIGPGASARTVILMELATEFLGMLAGFVLLPRAVFARAPQSSHTPNAGGRLTLGVLLLAALPVFLSESLHVLPVTVDVLFLKLHHGLKAVAEYDIGSRICMAYFFLGATLVQIVLPKISRFHGDGNIESLNRVLRVSSGVLLALGSLFLLPSFYFASECIRLLFDKDYPSTLFVFQWMPVWAYVSFMTMLNTIVLLAAGKRRLYLYGAILATSVNVAANWFLIRSYGVHGAVAARILGEAVFFVYAVRMLPAEVKSAYRGEMGVQVGMLAALIAIYGVTAGISGALTVRMTGFALSLALCGVVFWRRRVFSRETLRAMHAH